jgi:hypothetical protein
VSTPAKVKVFLCGEGSNELGSRSGHPAHQTDKQPGVLHALLTRVQGTGWEVGGARDWKSIRKFRMGKADHEDTHNVLAAAQDARDAGCDVLAFSRDMDRDELRTEAVEEGIRRVPAVFGDGPAVIGGVAVPVLEGWILALLGEKGTEALSPKKAEAAFVARGFGAKDGAAMARIVEEADDAKVAKDAVSLATWLSRARAVLPAMVARRTGAERS